jgi:DNA-binding NarL/FixJ family response regulator
LSGKFSLFTSFQLLVRIVFLPEQYSENMISNLTKKPDIIVVDDNLTFQKGLILLVTIDNVARVIGKASNGKEFIDLLSHLKPDIVLMDINMPQMNGMEATQKALEMIPDLKIIVTTMYGDEEYYYKMIGLGVKGFVLKSSGIDELEKAIQVVMKGESFFSAEMLKRIIVNFDRRNTNNPVENSGLTPLEAEVMQHICNGLTNEDIAQKMSIGIKTVKGHISSLLMKIGYISSSVSIQKD